MWQHSGDINKQKKVIGIPWMSHTAIGRHGNDKYYFKMQ